MEYEEPTVGTFYIYMTGVKDGVEQVVGPRTELVSDVQLDSFALSIPGGGDGNYTKVDGVVTKPDMNMGKRALDITGQVSVKAGAPTLTDIKWCFLQSVGGTITIKWSLATVQFDPDSPVGTVVRRPDYFTSQNIPANRSDQTNYGEGMYAGPFDLGSPDSSKDTPGPDSPLDETRKASDNRQATLTYKITGRQEFSVDYNTWIAVCHPKTGQYVPLKQKTWSLVYDSNEAGPWTASVGAEVTPLTKPPDFGESSIPYLAPKFGPMGTTTK
jgi:hypothetical protein